MVAVEEGEGRRGGMECLVGDGGGRAKVRWWRRKTVRGSWTVVEEVGGEVTCAATVSPSDADYSQWWNEWRTEQN